MFKPATLPAAEGVDLSLIGPRNVCIEKRDNDGITLSFRYSYVQCQRRLQKAKRQVGNGFEIVNEKTHNFRYALCAISAE
jgi:hypothetical protein